MRRQPGDTDVGKLPFLRVRYEISVPRPLNVGPQVFDNTLALGVGVIITTGPAGVALPSTQISKRLNISSSGTSNDVLRGKCCSCARCCASARRRSRRFMASLPRELRYERGGRSCGIGEIGHDASLRTIDAEWPVSWRAAAKRVKDTIEPKLDREINEKASATGFATDLYRVPEIV